MFPVIQRKIDRLRNGGAPRVLDLFAGCGGISLGFRTADYELRAAIEMDPVAAASHALNFFPGLEGDAKLRQAQSRDITKTEPHPFMLEMGCPEPEEAINATGGGSLAQFLSASAGPSSARRWNIPCVGHQTNQAAEFLVKDIARALNQGLMF